MPQVFFAQIAPTLLYSGVGTLAAIVFTGPVLFVAFRRFKRSKTSTLKGDLHSEKVKSDIILNSIDDGVVVVDEQKNIQLFNPAAAKLSGWTKEEAVGLDFHSVITLQDEKGEPYTDERNPFVKVFKDHATVRDTTGYLKTKAEKLMPVSLIVTPITDNTGAIVHAVGVFRDVSQERNEERQRAEFISTASHEMRTPVAAIEGYLALAMNDKVSKIDSKGREFLEKAHASTQHLGHLFQDLLTSAKAEDGRLSSHPVVVEMGAFLEHLTEDLRFGAEKKGMVVEYVVGASGAVTDATAGLKTVKPLYYAHVDPDRVREVITNLFDNAVKYSDKGKISVGITGDDNVVQVRVRDNGNGISAEDIPHLFQKFYRVDNSITRTIGGTGLGLFISRKIIELYNGRIWVESEVGKGSTFYINLPRLTTDKAAQMQKMETSQITPLV